MNKRLWVVGSGPSLKETPMDLLIGEDCIAMNKINLIWKQLGWKWRPTHYLKIDYNTQDRLSWVDEIQDAHSCGAKLFLWDMFKAGWPKGHVNHDDMPFGVGDIPGVTWIKKCKHTAYHWDNEKAVQSWHLPELCTAFGGISPMIQLATLLGYDEVYLLGCDLGYTQDRTKNHAIAQYTTDERDKSVMDNGNMLAAHKMAKRCSPIPVYNATIGGSLEVYPRVDIRKVLRND